MIGIETWGWVLLAIPAVLLAACLISAGVTVAEHLAKLGDSSPLEREQAQLLWAAVHLTSRLLQIAGCALLLSSWCFAWPSPDRGVPIGVTVVAASLVILELGRRRLWRSRQRGGWGMRDP